MALTPLRSPTWTYDDAANKLIVVFTESTPANHPDPANFIPTLELTIELPLNKLPVKRTLSVAQPPSAPAETEAPVETLQEPDSATTLTTTKGSGRV